MNHDPIPEESPLVHGRTQSQAFCPISPEPCKFHYFKSAKTHAFPKASEFFTGDDLKPTSPLRQRDGMMGATLALALGSALVVSVLGIRRDFASAHPAPLVLTAVGLFLMLTFASAWAATEMAQPEVRTHRDGRAWAALMAAILPGSALAFMAMKLICGYPAGLDVRGYSCLALGCGVGLLTAAALIAWLRRGAPTSPSRAGLLSEPDSKLSFVNS